MNDTYRPEAKPGKVSHRGNVTPASSGRVDGPAACTARRGPDGVRGVVDFCDPAKISDVPGLPTGDIPSRKRTAGGKKISLPSRENHKKEWTRYQGFSFPLGHDSKGVVKKRADLFATRSQFTGSGQVNGRYLSNSGCKMYEEVKNYGERLMNDLTSL